MFGTDSEEFPITSTVKPYGHSSVHGFYIAGDTGKPYTPEEVKLLYHTLGIPYAVAICVPPQKFPWAGGTVENILRSLVVKAQTWGYPKRCPLVLDIEEQTTELQFGTNIVSVIGFWQSICNSYGYFPKIYGSGEIMAKCQIREGWLAEWPKVLPTSVPDLAQQLWAWQFVGDYRLSATDLIDLDIFSPLGPFLDIANWKSTSPAPEPVLPVYEVTVTGPDGFKIAGKIT
jgi:hypothetical protein